MTRKNIFEILEKKYNVVKEMNKLVGLFSLQSIYYDKIDRFLNEHTYKMTMEELCDIEILAKWKQRGSYLTCKEIKETLGFSSTFTERTSIDEMISTLEYYYNILYLVLVKFKIGNNSEYRCDSKILRLIMENIDAIREHLHYEKNINDEEEMVILVPKNPAATAVAEITKDENIGFAILKYNHASLKGDLEGKKQLLLSIANEYEPLLKDPIDGFKDYFSMATGLLNNLHLRHNNKTGQDKKEVVANMSDKELEKWYDELYQLLLFCVLIKDNVKRKNEIDELLKKLKKK